MKLRVAIPLFAICLATPAITSGEQAQRGRGYRPRDGSSTQTAERSGGDNRGGGGGDRTSNTNSRPAERRAENPPAERRAENPPAERRAERRPEERRVVENPPAERRAENRDNDRDDQRQRYAVPRDNRVNIGGRDNRRRDNGPVIVTRNRPNININIGSYRGPRYYAPAHYDYWARQYYRWSPVRYAPWALIYGSLGFSNYGFYGGVGPNPIYYGYYPGYGYGPAPYNSPWQASGYDIGGIRLKIRPRDAQVFVDGYYAGLVDDFDGTFQSLRLEAGGHKIEIHMPGFEDLELDVHVQPGRTITLDQDLRPRP